MSEGTCPTRKAGRRLVSSAVLAGLLGAASAFTAPPAGGEAVKASVTTTTRPAGAPSGPVAFDLLHLDQPSGVLNPGSWSVNNPTCDEFGAVPGQENATVALSPGAGGTGDLALSWASGAGTVQLQGGVSYGPNGSLRLALVGTVGPASETITLTGYGTSFAGQATVAAAPSALVSSGTTLTLAGTGLTLVGAPTLALSAPNPMSVGRSGTTLAKLKAIVKTLAPITGGSITARLSPSFMTNAPSGDQTSRNIGSLAGSTKSTFKLPAVQVRRTVVPDGDTLPGMTAWALQVGTKGWSGHAQGDVSLGGGDLVYSDDPEYIANDTEVTEPDGARVAGGPDVEGVLYAERGSTFAALANGDKFRVYFNHENRTVGPDGASVAKAVCIVFRAKNLGDIVRQGASGFGGVPGDPVTSGYQAMKAYLKAATSGTSSSPIPVATTVGGKSVPVAVSCPSDAQLQSSADPDAPSVVNGIIDYTLEGSSPLQVGVVILDADDTTAFKGDPFGYHFQGAPAAKGNVARTFLTANALYNLGESGHSAGTFDYNTVTMTLDSYNMDAGVPWGTLVAGAPAKTPDDTNEYFPSVDTDMVDNGNYGVVYKISVPTSGSTGESAQVLLDPRGVGPTVINGKKFNNGFQGVALVGHKMVNVPNTGQPGESGRGSLINRDYGVGIGQVMEGRTFSFEFMPPGGATLPVAIVLAPAYLEATGTLSYDQGPAVSSQPSPTVVALVPK